MFLSFCVINFISLSELSNIECYRKIIRVNEIDGEIVIAQLINCVVDFYNFNEKKFIVYLRGSLGFLVDLISLITYGVEQIYVNWTT